MDIVSLIISLVSGAVGGNVAGAAMKDKSLGPLLNSLAGILGGGAGAAVLNMLGMAVNEGGLDMQAVLSSVASGGVGGAAPAGDRLDHQGHDEEDRGVAVAISNESVARFQAAALPLEFGRVEDRSFDAGALIVPGAVALADFGDAAEADADAAGHRRF